MAVSVSFIFYFFLNNLIGQGAFEERKIQERFKGLIQYKREAILRRDSDGSTAALNRLFGRSRLFLHLEELLRLTRWNLSATSFLSISAALSFLIFWTSRLFLSGFELPTFLMLASAAAPYIILLINKQRYIHQFVVNFPDALSMMKNAVMAGQGIQSALKTIAEEAAFPVNLEFKRMIKEIDLGAHLDESFQVLYQHIPTADMKLFMVGITIQMELGGNISELLDNIAQTIRGRITQRREMSAMTSQAKASAVVLIGLPFVVFFALNIMNPGYLTPLLKEEMGHKLLLLAGLLLGIGSFVIAKMVQGPKLT